MIIQSPSIISAKVTFFPFLVFFVKSMSKRYVIIHVFFKWAVPFSRMKLQYQIRTDKKRMVYTHQINAVCSSGDTKLYHYCIIGIHNFELLIVMYKMLMSLKTRLPVVLLNAKQFALFFVQRINIDLNERTDNFILIRLQTFLFKSVIFCLHK